MLLWNFPLIGYSISTESEQRTGSFKIRGALNKLLSMKETTPELLAKGVTTASSGNHALGCIEASRICGCALEIYVREGISQTKKEALLKRGATLTTHGHDCVDAEIQARYVAQLVEGAAALVVTAYLNHVDQFKGQKVVLLMCGANINTADLMRVLNNHKE